MPRISLLLMFALVFSAGTLGAEEPVKDGLTDDERSELVEILEKSRSELEELAAKTDEAHWLEKPDPERWSVGEVVEHLVLAEESLFGMVTAALEGEADPEWAQIAANGTGDLVNTVQDRTQKFQAPEILQPKGETPRDELLARYAALRTKTLDFVRSTQAPVKRHTAAGPPGKMNVHQWLALMGAHNLRHNQQIAEVIDGFK